MNELTRSLSQSELSQIGTEIEKLFAFQDRPLSVEKKAMLVQEIADIGFPFDAIIKGIRSLFLEELKAVKLSAIYEAISYEVRIDGSKRFEEKQKELQELKERLYQKRYGV